MNTDPLTEAELARVIELDAKATPFAEEWDRTFLLLREYRTLCPRLARELLATREKLRVAREALDSVYGGYQDAPELHDGQVVGEFSARDLRLGLNALAQLNQP